MTALGMRVPMNVDAEPAASPSRLPVVMAPSLLSADFARLGEEVRAVLAAGADWIHFDVMDNHYVPNLTFGPMVAAALRSCMVTPSGTAPVDVHLMVEPVDSLIPAFARAGAQLISFHPEASRHVDRSLQLIRDEGCQAALALNPGTPLAVLDHVLDRLDMVLLMTVNPGFGGQAFIPGMLHKIQAAHRRLDEYALRTGRRIRLQVDGGVKLDNVAAIASAGADTFVAGSAVFGAPDYQAVITQLRALAQGAMAAVVEEVPAS